MSRYFIGIDVSTTASKALVIDELGNVVANHSSPHELSTPRPLWSEQNPLDWWEASAASLRNVLQKVPAADVAGIGLTGQMLGLTALDEHGQPVRPAILWNDQRSGDQCDEITSIVGAKHLYQLTGGLMLTGLTAPKIVWVREHEPEVYARIRHVLLPKDYVRFRLSGDYVADVADGSGFALMDVGARTWSDEMLTACQIPREWMPRLCESTDISGYVSEAAAAETGLRAGTPIVGGAGDQPASGIGNGIVSPNQVSLTVGTSGVAFASTDVYRPEPDGRIHHFCYTPNTWCYLGVMLSAAGSLRWLHDALAPSTSYDTLSQMADTVERGSAGLLFAPYLSGERHPYPDPLARGAFVGLTLRHGLPHMVRAVMEGVAFGLRDTLELLRDQGLAPTEAVLSGGAANSPVWRQLFTDIMGIPLYTINTNEGAAFGAAIMAAVGVGAYTHVAEACHQMIRRVDTSEPSADGMRIYGQLYPIFQGLYTTLQPTNVALSTFEGA